MARKLTLNQARKAAWRGQTDTAISAMLPFAEAGDAAASSSLAELFSFRGRWEEVIFHAGKLIANPSAVYAGNVFHDMIGLLGRAGHETGLWQQIQEAAVYARETIDKTEERPHARNWLFTILNALEEYSNRNGSAPHELIRGFGVSFGYSQEDLDTQYRKAVHEATYNNDKLRQNPEKLNAYLFAIAVNCHQSDEAINMYDIGNMPANFDYAVHVARMLAERKELERSWAVLWQHMNLWWPVDKAQVAPVVLLTDAHLKQVINPERNEQVLSTPRGPEVENTGTTAS